MQIKINIERMVFEKPRSEIVEFQQRVNNVQVQLLSIGSCQIYELNNLPMQDRDPFDRSLLAQSNSEKMPILSADAVLNQCDAQILR